MRRFIFDGTDSLSDIGSWQVVIIARDLEKAQHHLREHLTSLNRGDYGYSLNEEGDHQVTGVVYSNVEPGR